MGRRQNMNPQPYRKHMEVYNDFSGGLNTVTSNDLLSSKELVNSTNIDLDDRGSVKRRHGGYFTRVGYGEGQGIFTFSNPKMYPFVPITIFASDGYLYSDTNGEVIEIEGLEGNRFQAYRPVEAVQFNEYVYVATGTKLVRLERVEGDTPDSTFVKGKVIEPYKPKPLEALYIGTNALADDPNSYMEDGEALFLRIEGVHISPRYAVVNEPIHHRVFISKPPGMEVEYRRFYLHKGKHDDFILIKNEDGTNAEGWKSVPTFTGRSSREVEYELKYEVRPKGDTNTMNWATYIVPSYKSFATDKNEEEKPSTIHQCNRILLHWGRLIIYGDPEQSKTIYISHLNNPGYFPMVNTLEFENDRNEPLTKIIHYRDRLVAFAEHSIQALYGQSPMDYRRIILNSSIGCIAPETAKVVDNHIMFLSSEGIYLLKSVGFTEDKANVEKIDSKIANLVYNATGACAVVADEQYQITFTHRRERLRYYYKRNIWVKDESPYFNFIRTKNMSGQVVGLTSDGSVFYFDKNLKKDDDHVFTTRVETKFFDFSEPYHTKKLKELQLLLKHYNKVTESKIYVMADDALIVDPTEQYAEIVDGEVQWVVNETNNLKTTAGTIFSQWEMGNSPFGNVDSQVHKLKLSGKCRRVKMMIEHTQDSDFQLLGLGVIFKLKKP